MKTAAELAALIPGATEQWVKDRAVRNGGYTKGRNRAHLFTDEQAEAFIADLAVTAPTAPRRAAGRLS